MLDNKGFDLWADEYDQSVNLSEESEIYPFAGYKDVLNMIYKRIREGNGKRVLDIGFGTGVLTKKLYDANISITGIDFSAEMLKIAQEKMPRAKLIKYDFSKGLPVELKGEKFDFIVCTYAIHHLSDAKKVSFIKNLKKFLTNNGEILIGDVAFKTKEELEICKQKSGDDWDDDEIYIIADELSQKIAQMNFVKMRDCAGVCIIR